MTAPMRSRGGRRLAAASAAVGVAGVVLVTAAVTGGEAPPSPTADQALPAAASSSPARNDLPPAPPSPAAAEAPPAQPQPAEAALPASAPVRVRVPDLGIDAGLVTLGLDDEGAMEVPDDGEDVGWYEKSPTPGQVGPTVLAGHVSWKKERGVFFDLGSMRAGQLVEVTREDGAAVTYRVTGVEQYPKDDFPTLRVYGNTEGPQLRLITCGGDFDDAAGSHRDNIVVYAEQVSVAAA